MNFFSRHKNTVVLATVLLAQFLGLAVQVKRQTAEGEVRVIRLLAVSSIAPFERLFVYSGQGVRRIWSNYIDLRNVRRENERLKAEEAQMRLDRARELEDARQARRLQALLGFKEQWIDTTVAAQVIGTSGTETSRLIYLDKGANDGIRTDMPVITPDGVVGKILSVFGDTSQVLMINDQTSGVGATLVNSRLQGILKGTSTGELQLNYIMGDEAVQSGDTLVTSGGDKVFPKGLPIGTVAKVGMGHNLFLDIKIKPTADLDRLEEVLVITSQKLRAPDTTGLGPIRASDILSQHLPSVPQQAPNAETQTPGQTAPAANAPQPRTGVSSAQAVPAAGANGAKSQVAHPSTPMSAGTTAPVQKSSATSAPKATAPKPVLPKPATPNSGAPKPSTAPAEGKQPQ